MSGRHLLNRVYAFITERGWSSASSDALDEFDGILAGAVPERVKRERLAGVLAAGGEVG